MGKKTQLVVFQRSFQSDVIGSPVYIDNWLLFPSRTKFLLVIVLQLSLSTFSFGKSLILGCFRSAEHSEAIFKLEHKYALVKADILWLHNLSHKTTHGWGDWHIKFK